MCNKEELTQHIPWTEMKQRDEAEYDAFIEQLVAYTVAGTESNIKLEQVWQLKRIADALERIAKDGILNYNTTF